MITATLLFFLGLALSAFFSGSETGFYRMSRLRMVIDAVSGDRVARIILVLANQPALFVATTLVGNNIANYLTSLAVVMGVGELAPGGGPAVNLAAPVLVAPVIFVCGELLPKNLFYGAPNRLMRRCAPAHILCAVLFSPVTALLWLLSLVLRIISKQTPQELQLSVARREVAELMTQGHEAGILLPAQRTLAQNMLALATQPVRRFAVPSGRVVRVTTNMSKSEILRLAQRHRRTLLPIECPQKQRRLVGYVRTLDIFLDPSTGPPQPSPLVELQADESFLSAIAKLDLARDPLGHVVDDAGDTVGFVTGRELRLALFRTKQ
ncbi:MAG: CNNM domain-containing protein [Planctomycetota bacterium]